MNYLIQAFACSPYQGGEYAVSWGWITHLYKKTTKNDCIYVRSLTLEQDDLSKAKIDDRVKLLCVTEMEKWNFLNYNILYQMIWQKRVFAVAIGSGVKFDFVHICSLSDFRRPGKWYKFKNSVTVFGSVGGGQVCPHGLREYESKVGILREWINKSYKINFLYRRKVDQYKYTYTCNLETQQYIPNAEILYDVPLRDDFRDLNLGSENLSSSNNVKIMFAGRLIQKKGVSVLIDALKYIDDDLEDELLIYGKGEEEENICAKVHALGLEQRVHIMGNLSYKKMSDAYKSADIFVCPSLRESGGSVLVEAMAHKLPIVALDMSFAHFLSEKNAVC